MIIKRERKGTIIKIVDTMPIRKQLAKYGKHPEYGVIHAFNETEIGEIVSICIDMSIRNQWFKLRHYLKLDNERVKVLGTEVRKVDTVLNID